MDDFERSATARALRMRGAARDFRKVLVDEGNFAHAAIIGQILELPMASCAKLGEFFEGYVLPAGSLD